MSLTVGMALVVAGMALVVDSWPMLMRLVVVIILCCGWGGMGGEHGHAIYK